MCLQNEHFIENRMIAGLATARGGLIHNVIHSSCGYREKVNEIRGLVVMVCRDQFPARQLCMLFVNK